MVGHGITQEGRYYQRWNALAFKRYFYKDGKLRPDCDIRAIIYAMGGPLPSELESYTLELNSDGEIYWFLIKRDNGLPILNQSHQESQAISRSDGS